MPIFKDEKDKLRNFIDGAIVQLEQLRDIQLTNSANWRELRAVQDDFNSLLLEEINIMIINYVELKELRDFPEEN